MPGFKIAATLGLVAGVTGSVLALTSLGSALEQDLGLRSLYAIRGPLEPPPEAVVVSIDKRSADRLGLPPKARNWPRSLHARLTDSLVRRGASVVVFDLDFSEPRDDDALAVAIARAERVVLFERIDVERIPINHGPEGLAGEILQEQIVQPAEQLRLKAMGLGPFPLPKVPARIDQFWAFKTAAGTVWPTLPAVALQVYTLPALEQFLERLERAGLRRLDVLAQSRADVRNEKDLRRLMRNLRLEFKKHPEISQRLLEASAMDEGLSPGGRTVLTALVKLYGGDDDYHLNYYGPAGTVRTIPYYAVLNSDDSSAPKSELDLSGKVIFVGESELLSAEQKDGFYTVFSREDGVDLSGVEIVASAFANLLTDRTLRRLSNVTTLSIILLFGGLVGVLAYLLPGVRGVASTLVVGAAYFGSAQLLFTEYNLVVPVLVPLFLQLPLALMMGLFSQYLGAKHEREKFSRAIRYYVPEKVAESLAREGKPAANPELMYGICLSTDAEHYTTVSEEIGPQELASLMNEYYDLLVDPVVRHHGIIAEIAADSMMGVWKTQQPEKDTRLHACLAALEIRRAVDRFNKRHGDRPLPTRIGLHAGRVALGNIGGGGHYAYSLIGDSANTTSRIEALNKHLGTRILASESVVVDLDRLFVRRIGSFMLEGKSSPLSIFEIIGRREENSGSAEDNLCERFASALRAFEAGRWTEAAEKFDAVISVHPRDGPTQFYLKRCRQYFAAPPPPGEGWIIRMETK
ncbi:MAG: CHASE2 domain-containing protein [Woeseia sp.]